MVSVVAFTIVVPFLTTDLMVVKAQNATFVMNPNNTRTIVNMNENLVFLVNATTNETISVSNYTGNVGNNTSSQNVTGISNENVTGISNENVTGISNENVTGTSQTGNLTDKFESLKSE